MKRFILKICIISMISLFSISSFAIQVKVQTSAKNISGIGFSVEGKQHGGLGKSYETSNLPEGMYTFGLRQKGQDVGCTTKEGEESIKLTKDSIATLDYDNGKCTLKIES
jgi:hypothetical protein